MIRKKKNLFVTTAELRLNGTLSLLLSLFDVDNLEAVVDVVDDDDDEVRSAVPPSGGNVTYCIANQQ